MYASNGSAGPVGNPVVELTHALASLTPEHIQALPQLAVQQLLAAAVQIYAAKVDAEGRFAAVVPDGVTATEAIVTSAMLLRSVNVSLFEVGMFCGLD